MTSTRKARELRVRAASASTAALLALLTPKCPLCVAAYLGAIGVGASVAHGAAALLRPFAFGVAGVALVALLVTLFRRRVGPTTASDCCAGIRDEH